MQEEWSYIVASEGTAQIGEEKIKVIALLLTGGAHIIVNTGTHDLVYLTGGEDAPYDIGDFPSIEKRAAFKPDGAELIDQGKSKTYSFQEWIAGDLG